MSKIEVNAIEPQCGTTLTVGAAGTTVTVPSNVVKSNALQASDAGNIISQSGTTITLGATGDSINLASGATQSGFGRTGTVDWDTTAKTATFSAVSGNGYFCNTTAGVITVNLPAGSAGAIVSLADYAATWQTNNLTVSPNGTDKIGSVNTDVTLSTEGQSVTLVYVDATQGWINTMDSTSNVRGNEFIVATGGTITTCGNDKIHTFTGPGTFTVSAIAECAAQNIMSHLIVAGGGGGGGDRGGGGGAGGYREVKNPVTPFTASPLDGYPSAPNRVTITAQAYPIVVGGGGAGGTQPAPSSPSGVNGSDSSFGGIAGAGGGGGKNSNTGSALPGGSGGGSSGSSSGSGSSGNTPPVSPPQGNNGGNGQDGSPYATGAGGGGAGAAGGNASAPSGVSPAGGAGVSSSITGSSITRAGGGGSTGKNPAGTGAGGVGGGGAGSTSGTNPGTVNTGGGGGSSCTSTAGAGGDGIVIIRYKFQ
jgi:hypothetical protein